MDSMDMPRQIAQPMITYNIDVQSISKAIADEKKRQQVMSMKKMDLVKTVE